MLGQFAKGVKDGALAMALKSLLNDRLAEFGEVLECQIDTEADRLSIRALMKGEAETIVAAVEQYEIERIGDDRYVTLVKFSCSREWIELLLNRFMAGRRYRIPTAVAALL